MRSVSSVLLACCVILPVCGLDAPLFVYHDNDEVTQFLRGVADEYPALARLKSIGKSAQGRDLWVLVLASSSSEHATLRPDVCLIGNMHGNEAVGRELLIQFIYHLVANHHNESVNGSLLDIFNLEILVSMNPDGFAKSLEGDCESANGRYNANGYDLNRNFPDFFVDNAVERQPETLAVMKWAEESNFILCANFHGGAVVASFPYDNFIGGATSKYPKAKSRYSMSRDDDVLVQVSKAYSRRHPSMMPAKRCPPGQNREHYFPPYGITNGAAWYPIHGSMQDWFYIYRGAVALSIEVSCCKYPRTDQLARYWRENQAALIAFLQQADIGVRGVVSDSVSGEPLSEVSVEIRGRDHPRLTTSLGQYWRILLPGSYTAVFTRSCYETKEVTFEVPATGHAQVDVQMESSLSDSPANPNPVVPFLPPPVWKPYQT